MPERKEYAPGTPNWVDLQTTDQDAAKRFYGDLFGWTFDDMPMDEASGAVYSMAQLKGHDVAAIAPLGDQAAAGVPPHWNSYVSVGDADQTAALAREGRRHRVHAGVRRARRRPHDDLRGPDRGDDHRVAGEEPHRRGAGQRPGAFSWNELLTPDVPKAAAFYNKVFGWDANPVEGMPYTEFKLHGESIGGAGTRRCPASRRSGRSTSPPTTPTPRSQRRRSSAAPRSWSRPTSRPAGSRCSPTPRARCSTSSRWPRCGSICACRTSACSDFVAPGPREGAAGHRAH